MNLIKIKLTFSTLSFLFFASPSFAADWDSLGSSQSILKKAKALDSDNKVRVVQKRAVDRDLRLEVSSHYGLISGGDSYIKTQAGGAQIEFHINPQWSLGFRYDSYINALTPEGAKVSNEAATAIAQGNSAKLPEINFPVNSQLGTISWYPIYGKLNLFDQAVTQFDVYLMAGAGAIKLDSAQTTSLLSLGSGVGLWLTQHITTRFEIRYQSYKDKVYASDPQINLMSLQFGLGFLL
jgi:outer membrane beta-barrel protein